MNWWKVAAVEGGKIGGGVVTSGFNVGESRSNRRFQRNMSNTAIRRRMHDMREAGINPILAAQDSASTPGGSLARLTNPAEQFGNSAIEMKKVKQQGELYKKQAAHMDAQIANQKSQVEMNSAQAEKLRSDSEAVRADTMRKTITFPKTLDKLIVDIDVGKAQSAKHAQEIRESNQRIKKLKAELNKLEAIGKLWSVANKVLSPAADKLIRQINKLYSKNKEPLINTEGLKSQINTVKSIKNYWDSKSK